MRTVRHLGFIVSFIVLGTAPGFATYDAQYVSDTLPSYVRAGETYTMRVSYLNTGTDSWNSWTRFATSNPRGRTSVFQAPDWINFDRPTDLDQTSIAPGQIGTFTFDVVAPTTTGSYSEDFELVEDGITWFDGTGDNITWNVTVVPSSDITRPELKCLSAPAYYPATGVQFTADMANDCANLNTDMLRVEFVGEGDANKSIRYAAYDVLVDRAAEREIKTLGLIDYSSIAYTDSSDWATQAFRDSFTARVQEIVSHYANRTNPIKDWEIWNEEDICVSGYCVRIEPADYALLLIQVYDAIKAIDPDANVVLGGISPKGIEYTDNYLDDLYNTTAIQDYYATNGHYPFDTVACHPYPEVFTNPDPGLANVLNDDVKAVMDAHGDRDKKVWLTEMGWNTSSVSESAQASYLTSAYHLLDNLYDPNYPGDAPYVERAFWFRYNDFSSTDLWGLYTQDLSRQKPSYAAYASLGPSWITKPTFPSNLNPTWSFNVYQETAASASGLSIQPDASDPLNGNVATMISGGFHSANTNPADHEPAFTDGAGLGTYTGLLMDYPGEGTPAWSGFWNLNNGGEVNLSEIRVFSGNTGKDGRVFHRYDAYVTTDPNPSASSTWTPLIQEVIPCSYLTNNSGGGIEACLTDVTNPGGLLANHITGLRLDFYATSRMDGIFHDAWNLGSANDRDDTDAAYESPLIYEVDAYFTDASVPVPVIYQETAASASGLSIQPDASDPLNGNIATKISGGFYSSNTDPANQEAAFTDGAGLGSMTGLLMDYPGEGTPAWSGYWVLNPGNYEDLSELRVFSGNQGKDGRVFHDYDVYVTSDAMVSASSNWSLLLSGVKPAPFGTDNSGGSIEACLTRITEQTGGHLAEDITGLRLDFYAVSLTNGIFYDQWNPGSPGDTDGASAAIESPLIYEVDAYFTPSADPPTPTPTPTPSPTPTLTPSPTPTPTSNWVELTYDDFESGWGNYTDGGADCLLYTGGTYAHQGTSAADIQDNSGTSSSFYSTNGIDLATPGYSQIKIDFWFEAVSMETGEDFLVQYYDGSTWQTIADYVSGTDFTNNQFYSETVTISNANYTFPTNAKIRFECNASANNDDVYIDEVTVSAQ